MTEDLDIEELLDDIALIDTMARVIHDGYLTDLERNDPESREGASRLPADRPWDDLADELKSQNWHQARRNLTRLRDLGLRVVAVDGADEKMLEQLPVKDIEQLAREEHDRWVQVKRAQHYTYGLERNDVPPDLRHPDLVAWGDLNEETQAKDSRPIERIIAVLGVAGLGVRDPRV